ncbi:MAG: aldo/keto reductase, partial [Beijerinckiaceae bacterium]
MHPRLPVRRLSRSGLSVSALGYGGAPLGDLYDCLDEARAVATVEAALRGGVTLLDAAPLYGHGLAEHRIGATLRRVPDAQPVLSTKVGRVMDP